MTKRAVGVLTGLAVLAFIGGYGPASAQEILLRYATQMPAKHHLTQADYRFAKMVAAKTKGRVKIEIYPAGQLYKGAALVNAVRTGALDMGIIYGGAMTGIVPLIDVFDIPFIFSDYRAIQGHWNKQVGAIIRQRAMAKGIKILSFGAYGDSFAIINSKRPLRVPADFAGLKIRGNTPMSVEAIKALGASPVRMSSSGVYAALQRGTIDGASTGLGSIVSRKWFEVSKNVTVTSASYSVWPVMIGAKKWASLPADIRAVIQAAATDNENYIISLVEKKDRKYTAAIESKLPTHKLSKAERAAWRKALAPVEKIYLKRTGADGENLLKLIRK
jgi:C4-dicarboxylate-binding protein DctP